MANIKKTLLKITIVFMTVALIVSCNSKLKYQKVDNDLKQVKLAYTSNHVMTKAEQDSITPEEVLKEFKNGNHRFKTGNATLRNHSEQIRKAVIGGQFPKAMVLSCVDRQSPCRRCA